VVDLLKCTSDTNLQRNYVGDGEGDYWLAGLGIPPITLTDGSKPGAESLFKRWLHEVYALFESQQYLKAPSSSDTVAARQQTINSNTSADSLTDLLNVVCYVFYNSVSYN
jgi:hypothetical protein